MGTMSPCLAQENILGERVSDGSWDDHEECQRPDIDKPGGNAQEVLVQMEQQRRLLAAHSADRPQCATSA